MRAGVPQSEKERRNLRVREEQRNAALRLWMSDASTAEIGRVIGVSKATAWRRVNEAIDAMRPHEDFERYRAVHLAEIHEMRRALHRGITKYVRGTIDELALARLATTLIKLQEREARLLGLDRAPTIFDEVESWSDAELMSFADACVREARAAGTLPPLLEGSDVGEDPAT